MKASFVANMKSAAWAIATAAMLLPGLASAHKDSTTIDPLTFSPPNPVNAGTLVTITGTYKYTGGFDSAVCNGAGCPHTAKTPGTPVVGETLQIQIRQSSVTGGYDPTLGVACAAGGDWVQVPPENIPTDSNGQVSKSFDTTGLGGKSICFRAHAPGSGGAHGASGAQSAEINLVIQDICSGVTLSNPSVSGGTLLANGSVRGPWTLSMTLKNCLTARDFKVQGGATAWAPYNGDITVSSGTKEFKENKKNTVIIWNVTAGEETITFGVGTNTTILPCGGVSGITQYLSGAWSAAYIDDNGLPAKSDYTARATVSSNACVAP